MVHFIMQKKLPGVQLVKKGRCYANEKAKTGCNPTAFNSNNFDYCGTFVPAGKRAFCLKGKAC